jgi:hypothetical protein
MTGQTMQRREFIKPRSRSQTRWSAFTGHLAANVRHTRTSYSRPRRVVDEMLRPRKTRRAFEW